MIPRLYKSVNKYFNDIYGLNSIAGHVRPKNKVRILYTNINSFEPIYKWMYLHEQLDQ